MRLVAEILIRLYQCTLSPLIGPACRFNPSCSQYAIEAIRRFGVTKGSWLAVRRISRCHPWHPGGYDPVPAASGHMDMPRRRRRRAASKSRAFCEPREGRGRTPDPELKT